MRVYDYDLGTGGLRVPAEVVETVELPVSPDSVRAEGTYMLSRNDTRLFMRRMEERNIEFGVQIIHPS